MKQCNNCGFIHDGTTCPNCGYTQKNDKQKYTAKLYGPIPPKITDTPSPSSKYKRTNMMVGESMRSTIYGAPGVNTRPVVYGPPGFPGSRSRMGYLLLIVIIILLIIIALGISYIYIGK